MLRRFDPTKDNLALFRLSPKQFRMLELTLMHKGIPVDHLVDLHGHGWRELAQRGLIKEQNNYLYATAQGVAYYKALEALQRPFDA